MNKLSVFASVVAAFTIFTYLSIDLIRDVYGPSALLIVYAGLSILAAITVYGAVEVFYQNNVGKLIDQNDRESVNSGEEDNSEHKEEDEDIVDKEVDSLKD